MVEIDSFPVFEGTSLSGRKVKFPDELKDKITLVGIAFVRDAQEMLDSWINPFEEEFDEISDYAIYEIPMIDKKFWKLFSSFIDAGMRSGIPEKKHDHVITYYGDNSEIRKDLQIKDKSKGYLFLLDKENNIKWRGKGFSTEKEVKEMINTASTLK